MDLLKLAAKIELDDSSYTKGIADAEKAGKSLAGKMGAMTVAVGNIAADMIKKGVSAINQVIGGAINSYADYQQLIGGVETLFKNSSKRVADYAQQSFKTTGLSANEYMETVTSFSASLLQGLKGDTDQAADLANMAVTDMADNANKMGTNISSIQNAYQGFAKQNYTMLDNLKLGYGGTREEMVRLINDSGILNEQIKDLDGVSFDQIVRAIHKVQEQMEISGTTAKEAASTISGSKASLKAAWEDMLSAIGGEGGQERLDQTLENFKTSFSTYLKNFIPTMTTTIVNSGSLVEAIADAITEIPTDLLAKLGTGALESGTQIVGGLSKVATWLIDSITNMFKAASADTSQIEEFGKAIGEFIGTAISDIAKNAPAIITGLFNAGVALAGSLVEGLFSGLFGENNELTDVEKEFTKSVTQAEEAATKSSAILNYMDTLVEKYGAAVKESDEWKLAEESLETVLGGSKEVFESYGNNVDGAITHLKEMSEELRKLAIQQALQEKLDKQYKLLGEYSAEKLEAEYKKNEAEQGIKINQQKMLETMQAYVGQFLEVMEPHKQNILIEGLYKRMELLTKGTYEDVDTGEKIQVGEMTIEQIDDVLASITDMLVDNLGDEEGVWAKDLFDNILDPETLDGLDEQTAQYQRDIKAADSAISEAQKKIDSANTAIATTEQAAALAAQQLNAAADAAGSFSASAGGGDGEGAHKAIGLDYVPFNGYKAVLHEGEAILTKRQNQERKSGMSAQDMATIMEDAMIAAMEKVTVYMSGQKVGDLTTRRVKNNINSESYSRQRAMGG